jgi:hypothetical protein
MKSRKSSTEGGHMMEDISMLLLPIPEFSQATSGKATVTHDSYSSRSRKKAVHFRSQSSTDQFHKALVSAPVDDPEAVVEQMVETKGEEPPTQKPPAKHRRSRTDPSPIRPPKLSRFPFSEQHVKNHQIYLQNGHYSIPTFQEYVTMSEELDLRKLVNASKMKKPPIQTEQAKPIILEARKNKSLPRSKSAPDLHLTQLILPPGAQEHNLPVIETAPVPTPKTKKKSHHKWNSWFL